MRIKGVVRRKLHNIPEVYLLMWKGRRRKDFEMMCDRYLNNDWSLLTYRTRFGRWYIWAKRSV